MNYLFYSSVIYLVIGMSHKEHRSIWLIVAACMLAQWVNVQLTDVEGVCRYWNRSVIVTATGLLLLRHGSWLSYYHALITFVTIVAYAALAYDVTQGRHILIYNNYEGFIYGLVGCQLIAIFPTLWAAYRDHDSSRSAWLVNLQRYKRS
jgi:hypothetical protein